MPCNQILAAAACAVSLASSAFADDFSFKLEGGLGFNRGEDVGIFSVVRTPPASATTQLDYSQGMSRGPLSFSYRAEGSWEHELGSGIRMRLGGILSGQSGRSSETTPVHYIVTAGPGGPDPAPPVAEIRVCPFPNPCAIFEGELSRTYREVMPELMLGRDGAGGTTTWVGMQGFAGELSEDTMNRAHNLPGAPFPFDRSVRTELDADVSGFMLAARRDRQLASGMTLLVGAGLGRYHGEASGLSLDPANPGGAKSISGSFDGTRAQLTLGVEKPVSKGMTLGATVRADYWTDQPRIRMDWSEPPCTPTICEPPARSGNFDLATDPALNLTFGLALTWRM